MRRRRCAAVKKPAMTATTTEMIAERLRGPEPPRNNFNGVEGPVIGDGRVNAPATSTAETERMCRSIVPLARRPGLKCACIAAATCKNIASSR